MSVFILCFFFFCVFCVSFPFFAIFWSTTTTTTTTTTSSTTTTTTKRPNTQIFLALSLYFKVSNSVFSYVVKIFWYDPLILLRHTWIKTEKKGVVSKTIYHIRQNRVLSLEIKLEMASNPRFFLSVFILCFFLFCVFCVSFSSFFCSATTTILLLLLLQLPLQCINGYIRVKLG